MKCSLILMLIIAFSANAFSQISPIEAVKKELSISKKDNEKLKEEIKVVQQENEYLRKTLNILKPVKTLNQDDLTFNLTKCEGNIKEQTITLTFFIINHKANSDFQFESAQAIDIQGKDFKSYDMKIGSESNRNKLFTDTPLEVRVTFKNILPSIMILKQLDLSYFGTGLFKKGSFEFRDINVIWK